MSTDDRGPDLRATQVKRKDRSGGQGETSGWGATGRSRGSKQTSSTTASGRSRSCAGEWPAAR